MTRKIGDTYAQEVAYTAAADYKGGETLEPNGASVAATIPAGTTMVFVSAEGGPIYYAINAAPADANSPGYVPQDTLRVVFSIANLTSLAIFGAAGAKAHIEYYQD